MSESMELPGSGATDPTRLGAAELAEAIRQRRWSVSEVIEAHLARIEATDKSLNAACVLMADEARGAARRADGMIERGVPLPPLHGVPITIKECFHVRGTAATLGVDRFAQERAEVDAPLVARLREAGGIILAKTNVPQLMSMHETDNPIYGRTNNPWDLQRGPGGSSGGEAALLSVGGSALGLGSDLGGSIRQPAHSCGICGLKPTSGRLTDVVSRTTWNGLEAIANQPGPMARRVADLRLAMHVLAEPGLERLDHRVPPVPWHDPAEVSLRGLRVGIWMDDGFFPPSPAIRRAVQEAATALNAAGVTVEPLTPPDVRWAMELFMGLASADGGADARRLLDNGKVDRQLRKLLLIAALPRPLLSTLSAGFRAFGQPRTADALNWIGGRRSARFWRMTLERFRYTSTFLATMARDGLDAVVCPPHALPALKHGTAAELSMAASYAMLFNLLGMPAGVVPATRVRAGEESDRLHTRDRIERLAVKTEQGSVGLPVGVQVAAPHWREDVVLAIMQCLESYFRQQADFPETPPLVATTGPAATPS